ncbi:sensor histidine kinase [Spirosoma aerophilum]
MPNRLTSKEKWQLSLRLMLLYSPLLLYVNMPQSAWTSGKLGTILGIFLGFNVVVLGLYFIWITVTDWLQDYLFGRFGQDFFFQFNWLAVLLPILIALGLAGLYTFALQLVGKLLFMLYMNGFLGANAGPSNEPPQEVLRFIQRANNGFSVAIMLSVFYLTLTTRSYQQLKNVQFRAERLEKEALLSQFEALKSQLSPHFLFNSLSILTSLIHEDVDLSEQFIKRLSKAYRYILEQRDQDLVLLRTELDFIESYTFLLKIRFENKFDVLIDVPQSVQQQYRIAPLTLQLLVENAVKHNRMSIQEPLQVRIHVQDGWLVIENPLQDRDKPEPSTGIGLNNIINRYALLTDQRVECRQESALFVVKIPLLP